MVRPLLYTVPLIFLAACSPGAEVDSSGTSAAADGTLYVTNKRGNSLSVVDLRTGAETRRIDTCDQPHELALSPVGNHIAVACYGGTTVDIFRLSDMERAASIELGANARPHGIVWHDNGAIYVTAEGRQSMFRIEGPLDDLPELYEFVTMKDGTHMLAISPDATIAWTMDLGAGTVSRVDLTGQYQPVSRAVGVEPEGIALSPDGASLWISARGGDRALELDPATLAPRREVATGRFPLRLAIRPQGDVAITSNLADGSLSVIDLATGRVTRTIAVSSPAQASARQQVTILWAPNGERIYVAETASDTVAEVDFASGEVLRRLSVGPGGDGLAIRVGGPNGG